MVLSLRSRTRRLSSPTPGKFTEVRAVELVAKIEKGGDVYRAAMTVSTHAVTAGPDGQSAAWESARETGQRVAEQLAPEYPSVVCSWKEEESA